MYTETMFVGEIGSLQKELTELALKIASENYNLELDFSHPSIKNVEAILADLHKKYKKNGNMEGFRGISLEFGCYIAATIQKNTRSGHFEKDHPDIGENTFPFYWNEKAIFPCAWCENRLYDGPGDDVAIKYRVLVLSEIKT